MAWTTPETAVAGQVLTAAYLNTNLVANTQYLKDEADNVGLVHLNTTTFSSTTTGRLQGVFNATYRNYRIIYSIDTSSASQALYGQVVSGSTPDAGANYRYAGFNSGATLINSRSTSNTVWDIGSSTSGVTGAAMVVIDIQDPFQASATFVTFLSFGATDTANGGGGRHISTTSYDGFQLYPSTGTYSGNARVYGYRNS